MFQIVYSFSAILLSHFIIYLNVFVQCGRLLLPINNFLLNFVFDLLILLIVSPLQVKISVILFPHGPKLAQSCINFSCTPFMLRKLAPTKHKFLNLIRPLFMLFIFFFSIARYAKSSNSFAPSFLEFWNPNILTHTEALEAVMRAVKQCEDRDWQHRE